MSVQLCVSLAITHYVNLIVLFGLGSLWTSWNDPKNYKNWQILIRGDESWQKLLQTINFNAKLKYL